MLRTVIVVGFLVVLAIILLLIFGVIGGDNKHKALCWQPSYAQAHTLHNNKTFQNLGHELPLGSRHCRS